VSALFDVFRGVDPTFISDPNMRHVSLSVLFGLCLLAYAFAAPLQDIREEANRNNSDEDDNSKSVENEDGNGPAKIRNVCTVVNFLLLLLALFLLCYGNDGFIFLFYVCISIIAMVLSPLPPS
jgi:hypothetical protein